MKAIGRSLILFIFLSFVMKPAMSQTLYGFKGGVQLANMQGYSDFKPKPLTTIQIKGVAFVPVNEAVTLTPSFGYSGKGKQYEDIEFTDDLGNNYGVGDMHYLFNYLQLTFPVSYKLVSQAKDEYYLGAGPYIEYAINGKSKIKHVSLPSGDQVHNIFPSDVYYRIDAGLVLEIVARIRQNFLIAGNFDIGLTNITKTSSYIRNQVGGFSVGYLFGRKSN